MGVKSGYKLVTLFDDLAPLTRREIRVRIFHMATACANAVENCYDKLDLSPFESSARINSFSVCSIEPDRTLCSTEVSRP